MYLGPLSQFLNEYTSAAHLQFQVTQVQDKLFYVCFSRAGQPVCVCIGCKDPLSRNLGFSETASENRIRLA